MNNITKETSALFITLLVTVASSIAYEVMNNDLTPIQLEEKHATLRTSYAFLILYIFALIAFMYNGGDFVRNQPFLTFLSFLFLFLCFVFYTITIELMRDDQLNSDPEVVEVSKIRYTTGFSFLMLFLVVEIIKSGINYF